MKKVFFVLIFKISFSLYSKGQEEKYIALTTGDEVPANTGTSKTSIFIICRKVKSNEPEIKGITVKVRFKNKIPKSLKLYKPINIFPDYKFYYNQKENFYASELIIKGEVCPIMLYLDERRENFWIKPLDAEKCYGFITKYKERL